MLDLSLLLVFLGLTFAITMALGVAQTSREPPEEGENRSEYSTTAVIVVCVQALVTLVMLGGTGWFWLGALWLGFTLVCHHTIIHWRSRFEGEACSCAPFQCKDIANHETWVVAACACAIVSGFRV